MSRFGPPKATPVVAFTGIGKVLITVPLLSIKLTFNEQLVHYNKKVELDKQSELRLHRIKYINSAILRGRVNISTSVNFQ